MLSLARAPLSSKTFLGDNPSSFDAFFEASYTENLTTNQAYLYLTLDRPLLDASALLPSSLEITRGTSSEVIDQNGAVRQVLTADTLADVAPLGGGGYHVKVYDRNAKGAKGSNGLYTISASAVPILEWIMRTPNGGAFTDTLESILIDRRNQGGVRVEVVRHVRAPGNATGNKYTYAGSLDATGNVVVGGLLESETVTYSNAGIKPYDYTLVREISRIVTTPAGPQYGNLKVVSRRLEQYRDFSPSKEGGDAAYKRMIREVDGYGTAEAKTTRYDFYDTSFQIPGVVDENGNPAIGHNLMIHGRLKSKVQPDGNWEYYEYTDSEGAAVFQQVKYSAWRDASFGAAADGSLVDKANAKMEITSVGSNTGFTKVISHAGVNSSREEFSSIPQADGSLLNTLMLKSGSGVTLSTRTWSLNSTTAAAHLAGRIAWMENPDGTAETYGYIATTNGGFRLVHRKGAGNRNGVTAGTETTTDYNSFVEASAESVKDIASGLLVSFWIAPSVDTLGRPTRIEFNGNENDYETFEYSCCGLARKRNRDASVTTWTRDPLKRVYLRNDYRFAADSTPLITGNGFDGLVEFSTRGGILQNETTRLLNGDTTTVKTPDQDNDGTPETTTISYSSGGRITTTTTYPDGGTEIREKYRDGQLKSLSGTAVPDRYYTYGAYTGGLWKQESKLTATGGTDEWMKTYTDALGQTAIIERPFGNGLITDSFKYYAVGPTSGSSAGGMVWGDLSTGYGNDVANAPAPGSTYAATRGSYTQPASYTDADGKVTTYAYNTEGERTAVSEEMPSGQTRVTATAHDVVNDPTLGVCHRKSTKINGITTRVSLRSGDGYSSRDISFGRVTTTVKTIADVSGNSTVTTTQPDGTQEVRTTTGNLLTQVATKDTQGNTLLAKTYTYDALRRITTIADARTGTTTLNGYTPAGKILSQTDPGNRTTAFAYDVMGRNIMVDAPDTQDASGATLANITLTSWYPTGLEKAHWADQTYPVFKGYDEQGRMTELRTYRNLAHGTEPTAATSGFDLTSWTYNTLGLLANKRYADNQGPSYIYTPGGKLTTRISARGIITAYSYDKGLLTGTDYSDTTPDVTIAYDAFGRQTSVTQANQSRIDYAYDSATLALDTETVAYDLDHDGTADFTRVLDRSRDSLQRDTGWQLKNGTTVENSAAYTYSPTTGRTAAVTGPGGTFSYSYAPGSSLLAAVAGPAHTVTNTYETTRDVLTLKENKVGSTVVSRFEYGVNALGQRTNVATSGTAFSGTPTWDWGYNARGEVIQADSSVAAFDRGYEYDAIGNRKKSADSLTLPSEDNYTSNALNQYSVLQLNPQSAIANPQYDADGNMTSGPLPVAPSAYSTLAWDAENRLISTTVNGTTTSYLYDAQSRRIAKITGGGAELTVYDAWNPIAEYTRSAGVPPVLAQSYTWGTDLSGSLQGAGGVGGLLSLTPHSSPSAPSFFPSFDGNGNVSEYLDSSGGLAAHFEYDALGRMVATSGDSEDFRMRFSTKKEDVETWLNYYGYRYYDPVTGRWPSRDPIGEVGGVNVYGFARNSALSHYDYLGLDDVCSSCEEGKAQALADSKVGFMKEKMSAKGCSEPNIECKCRSDNDRNSAGGAPAGGSYSGPSNKITLNCNSSAGANYFKQLTIHEYVHAFDYCHGNRPEKSCRDRACTEIRAYAAAQCASETDPVRKAQCVREGARESMDNKGCTDAEQTIKSVWEQCYPK